MYEQAQQAAVAQVKEVSDFQRLMQRPVNPKREPEPKPKPEYEFPMYDYRKIEAMTYIAPNYMTYREPRKVCPRCGLEDCPYMVGPDW
jgi:hypothetical protein